MGNGWNVFPFFHDHSFFLNKLHSIFNEMIFWCLLQCLLYFPLIDLDPIYCLFMREVLYSLFLFQLNVASYVLSNIFESYIFVILPGWRHNLIILVIVTTTSKYEYSWQKIHFKWHELSTATNLITVFFFSYRHLNTNMNTNIVTIRQVPLTNTNAALPASQTVILIIIFLWWKGYNQLTYLP